jgi:CRISPR type III-B/RAMP module RAMP protein Cmr1
MKTATFQFELITPCFCGGAEPERQAEIRAPSIRGQFRSWFRTLGGFASLAPMSVPDQESMIFGSIAGGEERAGKLILRIKNGPKPSTTTRDDEQFQAQVGTDRGYLAFPLKSKRDRYTGEVLEYKGKAAYDSRDDGGNPMQLPTFGLYVLWRGPVLQWDDIKALVSVFANFGSLGFRSRRALGALRVTNPVCNQTDLSVSLRRFATPNAVAAFSFSISSANEAINKLAQWLRGWRQHGRSSDHRPAPPPIPPPSSGFDYALRDHDEGLAGLGRARPNLRSPPAGGKRRIISPGHRASDHSVLLKPRWLAPTGHAGLECDRRRRALRIANSSPAPLRRHGMAGARDLSGYPAMELRRASPCRFRIARRHPQSPARSL